VSVPSALNIYPCGRDAHQPQKQQIYNRAEYIPKLKINKPQGNFFAQPVQSAFSGV
jgi:hypothetical protein